MQWAIFASKVISAIPSPISSSWIQLGPSFLLPLQLLDFAFECAACWPALKLVSSYVARYISSWPRFFRSRYGHGPRLALDLWMPAGRLFASFPEFTDWLLARSRRNIGSIKRPPSLKEKEIARSGMLDDAINIAQLLVLCDRSV